MEHGKGCTLIVSERGTQSFAPVREECGNVHATDWKACKCTKRNSVATNKTGLLCASKKKAICAVVGTFIRNNGWLLRKSGLCLWKFLTTNDWLDAAVSAYKGQRQKYCATKPVKKYGSIQKIKIKKKVRFENMFWA